MVSDNNNQSSLFPWFVWLLTSAMAIGYVVTFGASIPWKDAWPQVLYLAEGGPLTWSWLWEGEEFKWPINKFFLWCLWQIFPGNLVPGMVCTVLPLSLTAAVYLRFIRNRRGKLHEVDAVIPLIVLAPISSQIWLWYFMAHTTLAVLFTALAITESIKVLDATSRSKRIRHIIVAFWALVLLILCSSTGLVTAALWGVGWVLYIMYDRLRPKSFSRTELIILAVHLVILLVMGLSSFLSLESDQIESGGYARISQIAVSSAQALAMVLGSYGRRLWPLSGALVLSICIVATIALVTEFRRRKGTMRIEPIVLLWALGALILPVVAIGVGRPNGALINRYGVYLSTIPSFLFMALFLYPKGWLPRTAKTFVLFVCTALFAHYYGAAVMDGRIRKAEEAQLLADLHDDKTVTELLSKHSAYWCTDEARFRDGLTRFKAAGLAPYHGIVDDPVTERLALSPVLDDKVDKRDEYWIASDGQLVCVLKDDHHIHSVEVVFRIPGRIAYTTCRAKWLPKAFDSPLGAVQRQAIKYHFNTQADTRWETVTFWTDCSMSQLKLNLHRQGKETHIKSIVANVSPRSNSRP
jgi:hypothetical protein